MASLGEDVSTPEKLSVLKEKYMKDFVDKIINNDEFAKK
jgi:hypothetical protein